MKRFAVVLSGCGVFDGSEIHESTLALLAIAKHGAEYDIFAPNIDQYHVINHLNGEVLHQKRNVLAEAARIARGKIMSLSDYDPESYDAIILPGGYGVAKNLSDFAFNGEKCIVTPSLESALLKTHALGKPIGALCIAPVILAKVIPGAEVTIGEEEETQKQIENMGGKHCKTSQGEVTYDAKNNLYTTPCYMLDSNIFQVWEGIDNLVGMMCKNLD